jgi:hypothetical protein
MLIKLLKTTLMTSSLLFAKNIINIENNNPNISITKTQNIKTITLKEDDVPKKDFINKKTINILINTKVESQLDEIHNKINQKTKIISKNEKEIKNLKKTNIILKKAISKTILDIKDLKKKIGNIYTITKKRVNVRKCPNIQCKILRIMRYGDLVFVIDKEGNWYKTATGTFIYKSLLKKAF